MKEKRPSVFSRVRSFSRQFWEFPWQVRVVGVGVVLIGTILAILPPSLFHSFNCELQNLPGSYRSSNGYFIDGQVIVAGPRAVVDDVIETPTPGAPTTQAPPTTSEPSIPSITPTTPGPSLTTATPGPPLTTATLALATPMPTGTPAASVPTATPPVESKKVILNLVEDCDLSYLDSRKDLGAAATGEPRELVMRLYEIPNGSTVGDVIADIGVKAGGREIFADPNYLTRLADLPSEPCALPGDPGGNGGRPFGVPGTVDPQSYDAFQMEDVFKGQWAFVGDHGIKMPSSSTLTGREVRVGVFDTSPYRISFPFINRVREAFPSPLWFTNWDAGGTTMASNHGLFVASIIHGIAPNSSIQLVRVLYEDGCGDMWALKKGLGDYMSRMSAWEGNLDETVINMSMGIRVPVPEDDDDTGTEQDAPGEPENDSGPETEPGDTTPEINGEGKEVSETLTALFNEDLGTLKLLLDEASRKGAIIIASAGNDSTLIMDSKGRTVKERADMQFPAALPNVIGVAATNQDGDPSCYSSRGDVGAPGGEGGVDPDDPNNLCVSRAFSWDQMPEQCTDMANCKYGLIGLARTHYGPRYMLWSGTSFAAPLVSGMAALGYEQMEKDRVVCLIQNGQTTGGTDPVLGTGLIDLSNLTQATFIPLCP